MLKPLALLFTALLLAGCASSPQQVRLQPEVNINSRLAKQPVVTLEIRDLRDTLTLGTRGGIYGSTNFITPSQSLSDSLYPIASQALTELGAQINGRSPFPIHLVLEVETLSYQVTSSGALPVTIELKSSLVARAKQDQREYAGRYGSSKQHKFIQTPSEQRNEEIINEILAETLQRMFNDPKLLSFLEQ